MRTVRGLALLFVMLCRSRFRLGGAYWAWRRETAEGDGVGLSRGARWHAVVEYARWLDRMNSVSKP